MFDIGWSELLVIGVVSLVVVGPKDLPGMFRSLGRITAKARSMAREFSRAMEDAADGTGVKEAAQDFRNLTSKKSLGLDKLEEAAATFEKWEPKLPSGLKAPSGAPSFPSDPAAPPPDADPYDEVFDETMGDELDIADEGPAPQPTSKSKPKPTSKAVAPKAAPKAAPKTAAKTTGKPAATSTNVTAVEKPVVAQTAVADTPAKVDTPAKTAAPKSPEIKPAKVTQKSTPKSTAKAVSKASEKAPAKAAPKSQTKAALKEAAKPAAKSPRKPKATDKA